MGVASLHQMLRMVRSVLPFGNVRGVCEGTGLGDVDDHDIRRGNPIVLCIDEEQ